MTVNLTHETLSALLERVRVEHDTGIDDDGWVGCRTCGVPLQVERDEEGQPLCNPFIRHRYDKAAEAIAALVVDALAAEKAARQEAEQGCDEAMLRNIEYLARADKAEARVAEMERCENCASVEAERGRWMAAVEHNDRAATRERERADHMTEAYQEAQVARVALRAQLAAAQQALADLRETVAGFASEWVAYPSIHARILRLLADPADPKPETCTPEQALPSISSPAPGS